MATNSGNNKVQVYIYDMTMGLAAQFSPLFLGKQINGVWHTGIVVYGKEWFFGGEGIMNTFPGGTIMGPPHKVEDLGETEIPEEMFREYLKDIEHKFCNQTYNLFNNNCNTFSNEIAQFLTSHNIPEYITNLPQEVLETPFGAQIKPMLDQMQGIRAANQPQGQPPVRSTNPLTPSSFSSSLGSSSLFGTSSNSSGSRTSTNNSSSQSKYPETAIKKIMSNGFTRDEAIKELDVCQGDVDKALVQLLAKTLRF